MHVLIEVSRILEGAPASHVACSLKFGSPRQDLPTEEEKKNKENIKKKIKELASS